MGHQITAGKDCIAWTAGAWQVAHWCEKFCPRTKPDGMSDWDWADQLVGSTEITPDAVVVADKNVPMLFCDAQLAGLVDKGIDEDGFNQCREFLRRAAAQNLPISGSY